MSDPLNRQKARWVSKTNRRVVMDNGEVITARKHWEKPVDAVVIWRSEAEVGRASGVITWWVGGADATVARLREMYEDWNDSGRPDTH